MQSKNFPANHKPVLYWLWLCLGLVALMVVVGGLTRLTESGLSMVEWKPTTILPPLNEAEWREEFAKYQHSPQYKQVNHGMTLAQFQGIFWLEYLHRLLGRCVGMVFLLPYLYFLARAMLPRPLTLRLAGIFALGGLQGVIGWKMVQSGLVDQPWVSPVRLAMHLGLACVIFGLILREILFLNGAVTAPNPTASPPRTCSDYLWTITLILLFLQILLGALVAGLDAGLAYDTFPTMNGEWLPGGMWVIEPWVRNLAENATTVHFLHRLGALIVTAGIGSLALRDRAWGVLSTLALQVALGVLTVVYGVPIALASAHQAVALLLLGLLIRQCYTGFTAPRRSGSALPSIMA